MNKRPIDIQRDSGMAFRVGDDKDGTKISDMFELNACLVIVKEKAIFEVKLADQIDPKRENPNIPRNVVKRLVGIGAESELVGRSILTARNLFQPNFLPKSIDCKQALSISFDAFLDLVAMQTVSVEFNALEKQEIQSAQSRTLQSKTLTLPSISDAKTRCKTFFQKADHVEQALWDIVRMFHSILPNSCNFEALNDFLKSTYGNDDEFTKFITGALPFLKFIRNGRNCLDHRNANGVIVSDFALNPNGTIDPPAIEINFRGTHQPKVAVSLLMSGAVTSMIDVYEILIVSREIPVL